VLRHRCVVSVVERNPDGAHLPPMAPNDRDRLSDAREQFLRVTERPEDDRLVIHHQKRGALRVDACR